MVFLKLPEGQLMVSGWWSAQGRGLLKSTKGALLGGYGLENAVVKAINCILTET